VEGAVLAPREFSDQARQAMVLGCSTTVIGDGGIDALDSQISHCVSKSNGGNYQLSISNEAHNN
jgi:hypothetical protein